MLISFSFENFRSFRDAHSVSMEASSLQKDDYLQANTIALNEKERLLKSVLIYGANASGKTNVIEAADCFKKIVLSSYKNLEKNLLNSLLLPFLLDRETLEKPSVFEMIFIEKGIKYRYGISILKGVIEEEWLYFTRNVRETMLFFREKQSVEYNKSSFIEAKLFVQSRSSKTDNQGDLEKTAPHVPFVSVLSVFQGKHSLNVTNFFSRIHTIYGTQDEGLGRFTFELIQKDKSFYSWALDILENFNISDLTVKEKPFSRQINIPGVEDNQSSSIKVEGKGLEVSVKKLMNRSEQVVEWPLEFESEGTRKIIHLLGPLYDTIHNGNILFVDEFDSKFHTLLTKYIFNVFHQYDRTSQIIANVQDTNLMDVDTFRRDQIWFVHKDYEEQDSRLYSLSDYKIQIKKSYSQDYLQGAFDAIPLFHSVEEIQQLMESK